MDVPRKTGSLAEANNRKGERPWTRFFARAASKRTDAIQIILRHRNTSLFGLVLFLTLLSAVEHLVILPLGDSAHRLYDLIIFLLLVPGGVWFLQQMLDTTETERKKVAHDSDLRSEFSRRLGEARTWEELVEQIVVSTHQVAPRAHVTLYVRGLASTNMEPEAACLRDGQTQRKPFNHLNPDSRPVGNLPQLLVQSGSKGHTGPLPPLPSRAAPPLPPHRYDLPVMRNDQSVAVLKLEYPLGSAPPAADVQTLKSMCPVIALALEGAMLQELAKRQAAASEAARQQIAQNLHDSLAQNISYLRLKLDQLTGEHAIREIGAVLQELERMRTTADEAYQQVRNTLDELNPAQAADLVADLVKHAHTISQRARFELRSSQVGNPYLLPSTTRQQILYIVREALHNIEKHAQARRVHMQFLWLDCELIIKITDDGCGFDPTTITEEGHYGLWIMQHRAQEVGGTLKITPAEGHGTEVTLWVPRPGYIGTSSSS